MAKNVTILTPLTSDICLMQPALKQCLASVVQVSLTSSLISISYSLSVVCLKTNQMVWNVCAALSSIRLLGKGVFGRKTGQKGGRSLRWRWSNGCCFISEQAGTDNSGERWFIDHSHCHGMSKPAYGRYEQTGGEEKTRVAIQEKKLELIFLRKTQRCSPCLCLSSDLLSEQLSLSRPDSLVLYF